MQRKAKFMLGALAYLLFKGAGAPSYGSFPEPKRHAHTNELPAAAEPYKLPEKKIVDYILGAIGDDKSLKKAAEDGTRLYFFVRYSTLDDLRKILTADIASPDEGSFSGDPCLYTNLESALSSPEGAVVKEYSRKGSNIAVVEIDAAAKDITRAYDLKGRAIAEMAGEGKFDAKFNAK